MNKENVLTILVLIPLFVVTCYFNFDLSEGRYALFMDEQIVFDETSKILNSKEGELFDNIVDGDQRYGRTMYYFSSIASYIPNLMYSDKGVIIATRMMSVIAIMISIFIASTLISSFYYKIIFVIVSFIIPFSAYYQSMPKPEPFLILFLILFLKFFEYRLISIFFLGLALGTKISVLPLVLFFLTWNHISSNRKKIIELVKTISLVIVGVVLAVPILIKGKISDYLGSTLYNSSHGSDDANLGVVDWLIFITDKFGYIFYIIFISCIVLIIIQFSNWFNSKKENPFLKNIIEEKQNIAFIISCSFLMPIILFVKRLWGFYLYPGVFFLVLSLFIFLDKNIYLKKINSVVRRILIGFIFVTLIYVWGNRYLIEIIDLSSRSITVEYFDKYDIMIHLERFMSNSFHSNQNIVIHIDPNLFYRSTQYRKFYPIWGAYEGWSTNPDYIVLQKNHCSVDDKNLPNISNNLYSKCVESRKLMNKMTGEGGNYKILDEYKFIIVYGRIQ